MSKPLPGITVSFVVGIIFSLFYQPEPGLIILLALVSFGVAIISILVTRWNSRRVFIFLFLILGWAWACLDAIRVPGGVEDWAGRFITLQGIVAQEPQVQLDGVVYYLAAEAVENSQRREKTQGLVQVRTPGNGPVYGYGDRLLVCGKLYLPRAPGNFGAFDYQAYLARRGVYAAMKLTGPEDISLLDVGVAGNKVVSLALGIKHNLSGIIHQTLDQRQAAILSGLLFGNRNKIDTATQDSFARLGVAHVLSVSGLHVGYVLAGALLLAGFLKVPRRKLPFFVFPVLFIYVIMTGAGPAVIRASIMAMVVLGATYLGREQHWPSSLALAALVILILKPALLFEVGFQLSFGATWGILYLGPWLGRLLSQRWSLPGWLAVPLQVTIAAQLGTLSPLVYHFNLLSTVAPLANLLMVPMVGLIMLTGFLGSALGLVFLPLGATINIITGLFIDIFLGLAVFLEQLPVSAVYLATPPWYGILLWYIGLVLMVELAQGNIKLPGGAAYVKTTSLVIAGLLLILVIWPWSSTRGQMEVHFIDVGQGDCILIRFPGGGNMLVDTGGKTGEDLEEGRAVGDAVVVPYLQHLGINRLDVLVITHLHGDHVGGLPAVLEKLKVEALVTSTAQGLEELLDSIGFSHLPVYKVHSGQILHVHREVDILVLGPGMEISPGEELNNTSVVLRLEYGEVSFLLTGDIEEEAQRKLLAQNGDLQADVLKVPHHGSRFIVKDFIEAVAPIYAIIQVGATNPFGHPAPSTLDALTATGANILRTDQDGAIIVNTDGQRIKMRTVR